MLPFSGLLKFFLSPSHLSFITFLIFPHFLVLPFCFHSSFNFFGSFLKVCLHTHVHVACLCILSEERFRLLHLRSVWHRSFLGLWGPMFLKKSWVLFLLKNYCIPRQWGSHCLLGLCDILLSSSQGRNWILLFVTSEVSKIKQNDVHMCLSLSRIWGLHYLYFKAREVIVFTDIWAWLLGLS